MSLPQRSSNISTSPLPKVKSDKRSSIKLSLLKINDSFVKPPDSSSKQSKLKLPHVSNKPRLSPFPDKPSQKFFKKSFIENSPSFSMYFSPSRDNNISYTFKDAKSAFDDENKQNIDKVRYEDIQKKREILRNKREHIYKYEPSVKPKLYQEALHIALLIKSYNEDFIVKAFDNTEEFKIQALDRICDIETVFYKIYEDFTEEFVEINKTLSESEKKNFLLSQKLEKMQLEFDEKLKKTTRKETPNEKQIGSFTIFFCFSMKIHYSV